MSETKSFLSKLSYGSVFSKLYELYENKEFSKEEIEKLKQLIEENSK